MSATKFEFENEPRLVTDPSVFTTWAAGAPVGEDVCYCYGQSCYLARTKDAAISAAMSGLVFLYQVRERRHPGQWRYMARRVSPEAGARLRPRYNGRFQHAD